MGDYEWKQVDFDHPSVFFILEDMLKSIVGGRVFYDSYFQGFGLKGNEKVLDFGCGGGVGSRCLLKFLHKDGHVTCVDISEFWIRRAKKRLDRFNNVTCIAGDIRVLDVPDGRFDVITAMHVIHDIDPKERQETIHVLSRKLAEDGRFFIREPVKKSHGMPVEEIRSLFSNAGLREVSHALTKSAYQGTYRK